MKRKLILTLAIGGGLLILFSAFTKSKNRENNPPMGEMETVVIGSQTWSLRNLEITNFSNGDIIPQSKTAKEWEELSEKNLPTWCYYNYEQENGKKYGKLYNGFVVLDKRGIAPKGWRVPSNDDWEELRKFLDPNSEGNQNNLSGAAMKAIDDLWEPPGNIPKNEVATNSSGFTALPNGECNNKGRCQVAGKMANWWSSSHPNSETQSYFWQIYIAGRLFKYHHGSHERGFAIRLVKD